MEKNAKIWLKHLMLLIQQTVLYMSCHVIKRLKNYNYFFSKNMIGDSKLSNMRHYNRLCNMQPDNFSFTFSLSLFFFKFLFVCYINLVGFSMTSKVEKIS